MWRWRFSGDDVVEPPQPEVVVTTPDGTVIDALTLAQANVGQGSTGQIRVTNSGQGATGPIALAITGAAANDFVLDNAQTTCAAKALAPAESCDVVVLFRPTAIGDRVATLSIASSPGGTHDVTMTGHAVMPDLHFNPPSVSFNQLEIGKSRRPRLKCATTVRGRRSMPSQARMRRSRAAFRRAAPRSRRAAATYRERYPQAPVRSPAASVTSAGETYAAGLTVHGARMVSVVRDGTGSGNHLDAGRPRLRRDVLGARRGRTMTPCRAR
ncbi:MAG: choice-of-anchor D domain-containing protein [Kofleriaceae bacterium]